MVTSRERQFTACERRESCGAGRGCGAEFTCVRRESVRRGGTYEGPNLGVPANGESLCTRRALFNNTSPLHAIDFGPGAPSRVGLWRHSANMKGRSRGLWRTQPDATE